MNFLSLDSVIMVLCFLSGDIFKTFYFILRNSPFQVCVPCHGQKICFFFTYCIMLYNIRPTYFAVQFLWCVADYC